MPKLSKGLEDVSDLDLRESAADAHHSLVDSDANAACTVQKPWSESSERQLAEAH